MNLQNPQLIFLREIPVFDNQSLQLGISLSYGETTPTQIKPNLQITQISFLKAFRVLRRLGRPRPPPSQVEQLPISRIRIHARDPVHFEKVFQQLLPIRFGQLVRWLLRQLSPPIPHLSLRQLFDLLH